MKKYSILRGSFARAAVSLGVLAGLAMASATALAADPHFSGPSIAKPAVASQFAGKGFVPNAAVTVMVKTPSGASAGYGAVTAADGSFRYSFVPAQAGAYTLTVTDASGKALAMATVLAAN